MNAKKKAHKKQIADKKHESDKLDQALKDSFPSSDPIQLTEPKAANDDQTPSEEEDEQPKSSAP